MIGTIRGLFRRVLVIQRARARWAGVAGTAGPRRAGGDAIFSSTTVTPIGDALQPILEQLEGDGGGRKREEARSSGWVHPADVLSMLLDLRGSMAIEAQLSTGGDTGGGRASEGSSAGGDADGLSASEVESALADRFDRLERSIARRMAELPSGRSRLPEAERLHEALAARGAFARRNQKVIGAVARETSEMYFVVVSNLLDRSRSESRLIRTDLEPRIASLGEAAASLVAIDALLCRSTYRFSNRLFARIPAALARAYAAQLNEAVRALPEAPAPEDLGPWYEAGGWLSELHRSATRLLMASVRHERDSLGGLIRAAAEGQQDNGGKSSQGRSQ